jgi:MOSC domain-containing protein YiiM
MHVLPQAGSVEWIGVRPGRRRSLESLSSVRAQAETGLAGDHYLRTGGNRQVTLIQAEHLPVIAALLGMDAVDPSALRRNLVISRINLLALKGRRFRIGDAVLSHTGPCQPCSLMEEVLGAGGYNAMRGHGGITAAVAEGGRIRVGDSVVALPVSGQENA